MNGTTLEVDKDITLAGHPVSAGIYSIWMTVEPGDWEVVLDPEPKLFHTTPPAAMPVGVQPSQRMTMIFGAPEGIFIPGLLVDGDFTDTLTETVMEFVIENGRAVSFEFRGDDDTLFARGGRASS